MHFPVFSRPEAREMSLPAKECSKTLGDHSTTNPIDIWKLGNCWQEHMVITETKRMRYRCECSINCTSREPQSFWATCRTHARGGQSLRFLVRLYGQATNGKKPEHLQTAIGVVWSAITLWDYKVWAHVQAQPDAGKQEKRSRPAQSGPGIRAGFPCPPPAAPTR
eukprot:scaffold186329_cov35-Tisochrysis_lutea.AAC.1